jgi:pimeloyl-ACP methyl ester carboxylesterase
MHSVTELIRGISVHCKVEGEGPPLLLLHGWGGQADSFAPVSRFFAATHTVYSLDFPGFGRSGPPPEPWSVNEYTALVDEWMGRLGLTNVPIIAHSFGGRVSILLASEYPRRVSKMVLTGSAGLIPRRKPSYYAKVYTYKLAKRMLRVRWVTALLRALGLDVEAFVRRRGGSADYRQLDGVMRGTFVRVVNQDLRPHLKHIRVPVLLIWGENDQDTPLAFGRIMEKEIPDAGLVVLQGGHFVYLEQIDAFTRITSHFLGGET